MLTLEKFHSVAKLQAKMYRWFYFSHLPSVRVRAEVALERQVEHVTSLLNEELAILRQAVGVVEMVTVSAANRSKWILEVLEAFCTCLRVDVS